MDQFLFGVLTGLGTTILIFVIKVLWTSKFEPWFEKRSYQGLNLNGKWISLYPNWQPTPPNEDLYQEEVSLKQSGNKVEGIFKVVRGGDEGEEYTFSGRFKDLVLTCEYQPVHSKSIDRGTFTLIVNKNGNELIGCCAFYEDTSHTIVSHQYIWRRKT